jgi:hypothetical protein
MIEVLLDEQEVAVAAYVGATRQHMAVAKRLNNRLGHVGYGYDLHLGGALGELAAAKALGLHWHLGAGRYGAADVGEYHVRTRYDHDHDLIHRDSDKADGVYVLVTTEYLGTNPASVARRAEREAMRQVMPLFRVWGWIAGQDARRPEWRKNYGGRGSAWFVPKSALTPVETLVCGGKVEAP